MAIDRDHIDVRQVPGLVNDDARGPQAGPVRNDEMGDRFITRPELEVEPLACGHVGESAARVSEQDGRSQGGGRLQRRYDVVAGDHPFGEGGTHSPVDRVRRDALGEEASAGNGAVVPEGEVKDSPVDIASCHGPSVTTTSDTGLGAVPGSQPGCCDPLIGGSRPPGWGAA